MVSGEYYIHTSSDLVSLSSSFLRFLANSDFVNEPVRGFKRSLEEMDPSFVMNGVARGTGSLARHTVGVSLSAFYRTEAQLPLF